MTLHRVYRPLEKFLPITSNLALAVKESNLAPVTTPVQGCRKGKSMRVFLFQRENSSLENERWCARAALLPERSWARRLALLPLRDGSCKQPPAKRQGYNSSSVIPSKRPDKVGRHARSAAWFCRSALQLAVRAVSQPAARGDPRRGGTHGPRRGARHLAAWAEHRQGPLLEGPRAAWCCACPQGAVLLAGCPRSVSPGGFSMPTTHPCIKHMVVFNYYWICCSVFLKQT